MAKPTNALNEKEQHEWEHRGRQSWAAIAAACAASAAVLTTIGVGVWQYYMSHKDHIADRRPVLRVVSTPVLEVTLGKPLVARIRLVNKGASDAQDLQVRSSFMHFPGMMPESEVRSKISSGEVLLPKHDDAPVGPNMERVHVVNTTDSLTESDRSAFHEGDEQLYLIELMTYKDAQGKIYSTDACFHIANSKTDPDSMRGLFVYCSFGNGST